MTDFQGVIDGDMIVVTHIKEQHEYTFLRRSDGGLSPHRQHSPNPDAEHGADYFAQGAFDYATRFVDSGNC